MNNIEIKRIGVEDAAELSEIAVHAYNDHYKHLWYDEGKWYIEKSFSKENLQRELKDGNASFFVIYSDKEAVGFLKLNIDTPFAADGQNINALELERIYLTKASVGKGIGKNAVNYAIQVAKGKGKKLIWLKVMDSSIDAIEFYKKMKFERCGSLRLDFEQMKPEYRGMYVMKKLL